MRTTVDLEQRLLERAKRRAASEGTTLSVVVGDALKAYLALENTRRESPDFELITHGAPSARSGPTPKQMYELLDEEDRHGLKAADDE